MQYLFNNQNKSVMTPFEFDLPTEQNSIIKVIGVGGGGNNAVNHMYEQGIEGVNFVVCNTDAQALQTSPIPNKIQLGPNLTQGLGAGANPEIGMQACEESVEEIRSLLEKNTKMVFIAAGMGGGTGTGAAPVIARIAREMGILTVAIVTTPFTFEGRRRYNHAMDGINKLREQVDTILVIGNDKIRMMYGNLTQSQAFSHANNILTMAAKSISEIITKPGIINVDFADVKTVMTEGGSAIMGSAFAEGTDRANIAIQTALSSPLLNDSDIRGAKNVLVNIASGEEEVRLDEMDTINSYIQSVANETEIIFGSSIDESLGKKLMVTIIATGFEARQNDGYSPVQRVKVYDLDKPAHVTPAATTTAQTEMSKVETTPAVENGKIIHSLEEETTNTINEIAIVEEKNQIELPNVEEVVNSTKVEEDNDYFISRQIIDEENNFDLFSGIDNITTENSIEFDLSGGEPIQEDSLLNNTVESNISNKESFTEYQSEVKVETVAENNTKDDEPFIYFRKANENIVPNTNQVDKSLDERKQRLLALSTRNYRKNTAEFEKPAIHRNETLTNNNTFNSKGSLSLSSYSVSDTGSEYPNPEIKKDNQYINDKPC